MTSQIGLPNTGPFNYAPLQGTDIRVIVVHPLQVVDPVVSCRLIQGPLESLSFAALSYVWGDPSNTSEIHLDGSLIKVTANLDTYLRKVAIELFKNSTAKAECVHLWIDALCIDQHNIIERNAQVLRMGSIYSHATHVNIWLGEKGRNTNLGIARLRELADTSIQLGGIQAFADPGKRGALGRLWDSTAKGEDRRYWMGIMEFFKSPWWRRTWILQEVALARSAVLICGQDRLPFEEVYHGVLTLYFKLVEDPLEAMKSLALTKEEEDSFSRALGVINLRALFEHNQSDKESSTRLQMLLESTEGAKAADLRDKVYGLLGMASDPWIKEIAPRYDLSVRQVYINTVVMHLKHCNTLSILGQASATQFTNALSLPSWVPHWEPKEERDEGPRPFSWNEYENFTSKATLVPYRACRGRSLSAHPWSVDERAGTLRLTGAKLDKVVFLSEPAELSISAAKEDTFAVARDWLALATRLGDVYKVTGERPKICLRRTMVGDFYDRTKQEPEGVKYPQRGFALLLPEDGPIDMGGVKWDYKDSILAFINTANKRRIAITSQGWLGIVPAATQIGDHMAAFVGGPTLYIVRGRCSFPDSDAGLQDAESALSFVGEAYFHGFMDGEALDGRNLSTIVLC